MFYKNKKIAFVLDHSLQTYRVPFFQQLEKHGIDITVFHGGSIVDSDGAFEQKIVKVIPLGPFEYRQLPSLSKFDIVVHMQNIRIVNLWLLTFNPFRRFKLIQWGIGVSSQKGLTNQSNTIVFLRNLLALFSTCQVLYSDYPLRYFSNRVLSKTFIAHNTVYSPYSSDYSHNQKKYFLFIGSLNKRKGLSELLYAFSEYLKLDRRPTIQNLIIIGDGPEKNNLEKIISVNKLDNYVKLIGEVKDEKTKACYFEGALACISPKQAGLSVLESFSYGVPFLTYESAISGGEHLNIKNNINGFLAKDKHHLIELMSEIDNDRFKSKKLGENAFLHYHQLRSIQCMAGKFQKAFNFALFKK